MNKDMLISRSSVSKTGNLGAHNLLQDSMPLQVVREPAVVTLNESAGALAGKKALRLAGRFQFADRPNQNGRIYEFPILENAVKEIQDDIDCRRVLGEFDHPPDAKVHLDRVSHLITKLWMEDSEVFGELEILTETTYGSQLAALVNAGVTIGISSRGVGDMETIIREGSEYSRVLPGYTIVTFDVVAEPSVHGSYLSVMESRNRTARGERINGSVERQLIEATKNFLID